MPIRPATAADVPDIMSLERAAPLAAHWTAPEYARIFTPGQTPRVALVTDEGGEVVGFMVARTLGPDWELENIAVAAATQRRGIATGLIRALLEGARHSGATSVYLEVRESNQPARALYEKCGFAMSGRRKDYYRDPPEDALVYRFGLAD